ncbi:MAG: FAD-dependent oxidoreductase [Synergistaceae bacterium]|nr:FAD-dependent oxidoreductase [Synergistaceae bacterium]
MNLFSRLRCVLLITLVMTASCACAHTSLHSPELDLDSAIASLYSSYSARRSGHTGQLRNSYDIIIAGAGTGGISAAIQAARMGASVLVVESSSWFGGQATAAGVSTMDDMSRQKSGIYLEFINRLASYYSMRGKSMATCYWYDKSVAFEPHVGQEVLADMITDARRKGVIDFQMNSEIINVKTAGKTISGVTVRTLNGKKDYACKILIDATEYGDVLPLLNINYRLGNSEAKFFSDDSMIQEITWTAVIKKYPGGVPAHLKPLYPLPGYELAKRNYESLVSADGQPFRNVYPIVTPVDFATHNAYRAIPDSGNPYNYDARDKSGRSVTKTGVNWGNDYPGAYAWHNGKRGLPAAYLEDRVLRLQIEREALIKTLHFIWYIQNELGEDWSVADDEYDNKILPEAARGLPYDWQEIIKRMPPIPYVRESRRIMAKHTLTSHEMLQNSLSYRDGQTSHEFYDAIAIGGYILDLHGANIDSDMEWQFNEKTSSMITNRPRGPFQVPMRILIPEGIDGLIAAEKNLSATRLAAGSLRLQPITMMTGQAAGALAAVSSRQGRAPKFIHPMLVQWELLNSGVDLSLCHYSDVPPEHPLNKVIQITNMYGLITPKEYPHVPSYNIENYDDPVLIMAIIKGHDKGVFGVDDIITRREALDIIEKAQKALTGTKGKTELNTKPDNFISRGDFAKAICDAMPDLYKIELPAKTRNPFNESRHRNYEYVALLGKLGILSIYSHNRDSEFYYGRPVTKGEAADIIVRAAITVSRL